MATKKGIKRAKAAQGFSPVVANVGDAKVSIDETGSVNAQGGVGSEFINPFSQFGLGSLEQAQGRQGQAPTDVGFDPRSLFAGAPGAQQVGQQFTGIGGDVAKAFEGFNPDAFAKTQFDRLQNLAGPAEQTQANTLASRLFSRGRLGGNDTASGAAFGQLAEAQSRARDQRALSALDFAGNEQGRLAQLAQGFGQSGANITGANTGNVSNIFNTVRGEDTFQQDFTGNLLNQAAGAQTQAQAGTQSQLDAINAAFAGADFAQGRRDTLSEIELQRQKKKSPLGGIVKGALGAAATAFGGPAGGALAGKVFG